MSAAEATADMLARGWEYRIETRPKGWPRYRVARVDVSGAYRPSGTYRYIVDTFWTRRGAQRWIDANSWSVSA